MSNFRSWYIRNQDAITWFIIGWLSMACLDSLIRGSYGWAAVQALLAYGNYKLNSVKMQ
jgi:hypothetical protein